MAPGAQAGSGGWCNAAGMASPLLMQANLRSATANPRNQLRVATVNPRNKLRAAMAHTRTPASLAPVQRPKLHAHPAVQAALGRGGLGQHVGPHALRVLCHHLEGGVGGQHACRRAGGRQVGHTCGFQWQDGMCRLRMSEDGCQVKHARAPASQPQQGSGAP